MQVRSWLLPFTYIVQVLTGKTPFRGIRVSELPLNVSQGVRPPKPEDASAIGFSDSLWSFVQRCWDGEMKLRPGVADVVSQLERAVADWDGVMPPCAQVEDVVSASQGLKSGSMANCKLQILISPCCFSLDNGTAAIFESSSSVVLTDSQTTSTSSGPPSIPSTQFTEPPSSEALGAITKPFSEQELVFGMHDVVIDDRYDPPSHIWRNFRYSRRKFLSFVGLRKGPSPR